MNAIQNALNLGEGEKLMSLGPVTIKAVFPPNQTAKSRYRNLTVTDGSGTAQLRIWGDMCDIHLSEGNVIVLKADPKGKAITLNHYNNKTNISADKCRIEITGQGAVAPRQGGSSPAAGGGGFLGQTVGMSLNNAGQDLRALHASGAIDIDDENVVRAFIWRRASTYLRAAQALESGKLHGAKAPTPQAQPGPDPDREQEPDPAPDQDLPDDDDCPF